MNTKLLALKRLGIEPHLTGVELPPKKVLNFRGMKTGQKFNRSTASSRHAYTFRLKNNNGGGTYLTDVSNLDTARRDLVKRYGDRMLLVIKTGI